MKQAKPFIHSANKLEILRRRIAARAQKPNFGDRALASPPLAEPSPSAVQGSMS